MLIKNIIHSHVKNKDFVYLDRENVGVGWCLQDKSLEKFTTQFITYN